MSKSWYSRSKEIMTKDGTSKKHKYVFETDNLQIGKFIEFMFRCLMDYKSEIIRCKDCKYGELDEADRWYCGDIGARMGDDEGNGFCSDAEKR